MTPARRPNAGQWDRIAGFPEAGGREDGHGAIMGALQQGFYHLSDRPARRRNTGNIWIHGYRAYDWANSYERKAT